MTTGNDRLQLLRHLSADKSRLALPLATVRELDAYLRDGWGITVPDVVPLSVHVVEQRVGGDLARRYADLHNKQAEVLAAGRSVPAPLEKRWYDLSARARGSLGLPPGAKTRGRAPGKPDLRG
jgi:hypothetical protein